MVIECRRKASICRQNFRCLSDGIPPKALAQKGECESLANMASTSLAAFRRLERVKVPERPSKLGAQASKAQIRDCERAGRSAYTLQKARELGWIV